jgi:hypothetical protein
VVESPSVIPGYLALHTGGVGVEDALVRIMSTTKRS